MTPPPVALPPRPWYARRGTAADGVDALSSIHDADGRLIAIVRAGAIGDLFVIAPDLLADLAAVLRTTVQRDADYRNQHGIEMDAKGCREALCDAIADAMATLAHAQDNGLPVDLPGLAALEETP
ncbi:hypothetical protein CCZ27_09450 [Thauera sinica]|nr:hypothetical protein CCZ27_09450 [Thauera sp. K11]